MRPGKAAPLPRVGISACLLGERVRYDGRHKRDRVILETLGRFVEWVPVCPEVELGLGVPRETLRLEGRASSPRLVFSESREDITPRMRSWARRRLAQLGRMDLCGYILKSESPSCGVVRVKVHRRGRPGPPARRGTGLFARALMVRFPRLPIEDEERLRDKARRDAFIDRVLAYGRRRSSV